MMIGLVWTMMNSGTVSVADGVGSRQVSAAVSGGAGSPVAWWDVWSAVFMLLFPIAMAVLVPAVRESDPARWRGLLRWLIGLTVVSVGGWIGWWVVTGSMLKSWWLWGVYPVLLLLGIMVANRKREDPALVSAESAGALGTARTASLTVRRAQDMGVAVWWWWVVGTVAAAFVAAAGARFLVEFGDRGELIRAWAGLGMAVIGVGEVALFAWVVRRLLPREGRTLDPSGSKELIEGYERMSRLRARGMFVLGVMMTLLLGGAGVAMAWMGAGDGRALGLIGGAVGSTVGLAGGVFGVWCTIRAMWLQDRRLELTRGKRAESTPTA